MLTPKELRAIADKYAGEACTLNGQVAKVNGRLNQFATIATLDVGGPAVEFSWDAVQRIMERDKSFKAETGDDADMSKFKRHAQKPIVNMPLTDKPLFGKTAKKRLKEELEKAFETPQERKERLKDAKNARREKN